MTPQKLNKAMAEAQRFVKLANELKAGNADQSWPFPGSAKSGAVRRASMDLSRSLADLRKPRS